MMATAQAMTHRLSLNPRRTFGPVVAGSRIGIFEAPYPEMKSCAGVVCDAGFQLLGPECFFQSTTSVAEPATPLGRPMFLRQVGSSMPDLVMIHHLALQKS
jgi:hypothetical protein